MATLFLLFLSLSAQASWQYNENSGIGIYQPEGWRIQVDGRATRIEGPAEDHAQSQLFLGSDWAAGIDQASLKEYVKQETGAGNLREIKISGLRGFRAGSATKGAIYLLRIRENVIVIQFQLRGSRDQREEGQTMLRSIEIRTKGIEN